MIRKTYCLKWMPIHTNQPLIVWCDIFSSAKMLAHTQNVYNLNHKCKTNAAVEIIFGMTNNIFTMFVCKGTYQISCQICINILEAINMFCYFLYQPHRNRCIVASLLLMREMYMSTNTLYTISWSVVDTTSISIMSAFDIYLIYHYVDVLKLDESDMISFHAEFE